MAKTYEIVDIKTKTVQATLSAATGFITEPNLVLYDGAGKSVAVVRLQPGFEARTGTDPSEEPKPKADGRPALRRVAAEPEPEYVDSQPEPGKTPPA